jgi:hypothetical protein
MRATCTLTAGKVTSITLLSKGYGYAGATLAVAFSGGGGAGAAATATLVYKGYSRTIDNLTNFENIKRYRSSSGGRPTRPVRFLACQLFSSETTCTPRQQLFRYIRGY